MMLSLAKFGLNMGRASPLTMKTLLTTFKIREKSINIRQDKALVKRVTDPGLPNMQSDPIQEILLEKIRDYRSRHRLEFTYKMAQELRAQIQKIEQQLIGNRSNEDMNFLKLYLKKEDNIEGTKGESSPQNSRLA